MFTLTTAIQVPGAAEFFSFDISWFDPKLNRYFLADRNNKAIDVVDPRDNSITQFHQDFAGFTGDNDTSGPDGVLTANNSTELWVGDSPGRVWVMNSRTGAVKNLPRKADNPISVGGTTRADELCYDPQDNLIMIASPAEGNGKTTFPFVTFISTAGKDAYTVVGKITFDGTGVIPKATSGLEQCGWSPKTGKFYQNVPVDGTGDGAVAVIDPKTMTVEKKLPVPIADCALPQGMAIGPDNQILLGCNGPSPDTGTGSHRNTVIISDTGAVLKVFPDLGGADQVWFNEGDGHYFIPSCNTACRTVSSPQEGAEVLGIVNSAQLLQDQSVIIANTTTTPTSGTQRRIHSVAADPNTNQVFVPIPAAGGAAPTWDPTLCGKAPTLVGSPTDKTGCIAIFAKTNDDRSSVAQERGKDDRQQ